MAPSAIQASAAASNEMMPTKTAGGGSRTKDGGLLGYDAEYLEQVLREIRCLAADLVQQFKGGHPGTAIGAASIGMALWGDAMTFNPKDPLWCNRDRFVLSAGHACLLQYIYLHLTGYKAWTLDMLKRYHSTDFRGDFLAAGHPEIDPINGIEVTTGPLGQGIANSVGLAIASKSTASHYNQPGMELVSNKVFCFTGDGCIQEGVGQEALSLAGHLGLDNLILIYDCNKITVDGSIDSCCTEDTVAKLRAMDWNVLEVQNGSIHVAAIIEALRKAKNHKGQPTCVKVNTVIGFGSEKQNTGPVHGAALGDADVEYMKKGFGRPIHEKFGLSPAVYETFARVAHTGQTKQNEWNATFKRYSESYPDLAQEFLRRNVGDASQDGSLHGALPKGWQDRLPPKSQIPSDPIPTRKASGIVVQALCPEYKEFMVGSADLLDSTFVSWRDQVEFQKPVPGSGGDFSGRQIRYGIREHSMAAITNGLAAYSRNGFLPVMSTFFMFYLYAAPAIRMTALQKLQTIGIATHDSIGIGEDGPTHQPIGLASLFRAIPNILFFRPADAEEVMGCWTQAILATQTPSILSLSRHPLPLLSGSDRSQVQKGAYTVFEIGFDGRQPRQQQPGSPILTLVATGSEVNIAIETAQRLVDSSEALAKAAKSDSTIRVVSMPCMSLFDAQPRSYRLDVIPSTTSLTVGIEAWASLPWPRYVGASLSMHTFGHSGPQQELFKMYGFGVDSMVQKIDQYASSRISAQGIQLPGVGEFEELLLGYAGH